MLIDCPVKQTSKSHGPRTPFYFSLAHPLLSLGKDHGQDVPSLITFFKSYGLIIYISIYTIHLQRQYIITFPFHIKRAKKE